MKKEELLNLITEIGTIDDASERRTRLTSLSDEVTAICDSNEAITESNQTFEADIKKLQEYNMQLFLRVGGQTKQKEDEADKSEPLKYEDLFNEKGEIK